ncbi:MAG TPA: hypothetical protein VHO48_13730, partial [Anaerolineaceae bacterium]|nr:hypothetical protein [Anaerolineaceae bacterium]
TWAERSAMPTARAYAAAAEAGGKIHIVGGSDGVKPLTVNEVYYPQRDQDGEPAWENAAALPEPRSHLALAGLADVLYAFGGQAESAGQAQRPLGYLSDTGAWQELENPPQPVGEQAAVVVLGNYLDVFGGENRRGARAGFPVVSSDLYGCSSVHPIKTIIALSMAWISFSFRARDMALIARSRRSAEM